MSAFVDALTRYVMDPTTWQSLTTELDHLGDHFQPSDASELLAELAKAETLSWQFRAEASAHSPNGFIYALLDRRDRVVAHSDNLAQLGEYLRLRPKKQTLAFTADSSQQSFEEAKARLKARPRGHILVDLAHPTLDRHRYGYLVAGDELPEGLRQQSAEGVRALLIAQEQPTDKLRNVVQASFGLTAAETEVMLRIATGMTLKQTAEELAVSVNTARNHLQAIYDKSGINRQGDLVLVVTQLSIILAAAAVRGDADETAASQPEPHSGISTPHLMNLPEGRRLAFRTYGDPMGYPVLCLHQNIGSSLLPPGTDALARARGLYLIAPDRPGVGASDPHPALTFETVCDDLTALLDHLRVPRCIVLGYLGGGGFAVQMACRYPSRVTRLMLVAARPPAPMKGRFEFLTTLRNRMLRQPWLLSTFFNILRNRASEETNGKLIYGVYGAVEHDRQLLDARPELFRHMVASSLESMVNSAAGVVSELACYDLPPQDPADALELPITVWHGTDDRLASLSDLQAFLGDKITRLRTFDNAGSLILLEHWEAALDELSAGADDL